MIVPPVASIAAVVASTPSPTPVQDMTVTTVTPGLPGFFVFFLVCVATILLLMDMGRRVRRITARHAVEDRMRERYPDSDSPGEREDS